MRKFLNEAVSGHTALVAFFIVFNALYLVLRLLRYTFILSFSWTVLTIFLCAVIVFFTVYGVKQRFKQVKLSTPAAVCLPLTALFFGIITMMVSDIPPFHHFLLFYLSMICALVLFFFCVHCKALKIAFSAIYTIIYMPLFLFLPGMLLGVMLATGSVTEVKSAEISPSATYVAEIIVHSAGAVGNSTRVNITGQSRSINIFIGELRRRPINVFAGRWSAHHGMSLRWDCDDILYLYTRDGTMRFLRQGRNWVRE